MPTVSRTWSTVVVGAAGVICTAHEDGGIPRLKLRRGLLRGHMAAAVVPFVAAWNDYVAPFSLVVFTVAVTQPIRTGSLPGSNVIVDLVPMQTLLL